MVSQSSWVFYGAVPQDVGLNPTDLGNAPNPRRVGGVELWSSSHPSCFTYEKDTETVFNRFYSLLAGNSDSDSDVLQDVYRQATATSEEAGDAKSWGTVWQQQNKAENDCRRHWKEELWRWCGWKSPRGVLSELLHFSFFDSISSVQSVHFFTTCLISPIDFGKSWKWRSSPCAFVQARLWAIKWICGWNILFKIRRSRSNGVTV